MELTATKHHSFGRSTLLSAKESSVKQRLPRRSYLLCPSFPQDEALPAKSLRRLRLLPRIFLLSWRKWWRSSATKLANLQEYPMARYDLVRLEHLQTFRDLLTASGVSPIRDSWKEVKPHVSSFNPAWDMLIMIKCCQGVSDVNVLPFFAKQFEDGFRSTPQQWIAAGIDSCAEFLKSTSKHFKNASELTAIAQRLVRDHGREVPLDLHVLMTFWWYWSEDSLALFG